MEMWKPGSYAPGWVGGKQQVALWLDVEGDFLVQERWQRLLGTSPRLPASGSMAGPEARE